MSTLICVLGPIRTASLHVAGLKAAFLNTAEQDPSALSLSVVQCLVVRLFHFLSGVHDEAPQFVR